MENKQQTTFTTSEISRTFNFVEQCIDECSELTITQDALKNVALVRCTLQEIQAQQQHIFLARDAFNHDHLLLLLDDALIQTVLSNLSGIQRTTPGLDAFDIEMLQEVMGRCYQTLMRKYTARTLKDPLRLVDESLLSRLQQDSQAEMVIVDCLLDIQGQSASVRFAVSASVFDAFLKTSSSDKLQALADEVNVSASNLALMENIPLDVHVELGCISRKVKDILEFTPGMILELDTTVTTPVRVIANNQLVATGEVVEVNENYGVEIKKIMEKVDIRK
ncbi:MAG: FliM/FliN family flagellar motor switch protein [Erysipelotrichaceae bacterium]